jgi:hypothetical protein
VIRNWTVTDNCGNTITCGQAINIIVPAPTCPGGMQVCSNTDPFVLTGGLPVGGTYSGAGVMGGIFNPATAGLGDHSIQYNYTEPVTNCTTSCSFNIEVLQAPPQPSCASDYSVCIDTMPIMLTGGFPMGGTYSIDGVPGNIFTAAISGVGPHVITYSFVAGVCTTSCSFTITVKPLPVVNCPSSFSIDIATAPFALTGGTPFGGTYTGAGVAGNQFNASIAGIGPHLITYSYTSPATGCSNTCTFTITVTEEANCSPMMEWVLLPTGTNTGSCPSMTNCCTNTICYGLEYTPAHTGLLEDYTTGFTVPCPGPNSPIISNTSCVMNDNSGEIEACGPPSNAVLFNSSGNEGALPVFACVPVILHKVCFSIPMGGSMPITEDIITDLSTSIQTNPGPPPTTVTEFPIYTTTTLTRTPPVVPEDQFLTVSCPQYAMTPAYPEVLDYCGMPITATVTNILDTPDPLTCEGTRKYTFTYATCEMPPYTFTWHYTYTIQRNDFTLPGNGFLQVSCPDATDTPPALPNVYDNCNNLLSPVGDPIVSAKPSCEGDRTYQYTYEDCDHNSHVWTFTYTVERNDFAVPANAGSTVECATSATAPTPPSVNDNCGNHITPTGPLLGGTYTTCEGTITYTWHYQDCEGNNHNWVYTYTIDHTTLPTQYGGPVATSSTIECPSGAVAPTLPVVKDVCGNTLTAMALPPVISSPITLVYYDRYVKYTGVSINGGGNVMTVAPGSSVNLAYNLSVTFDYFTGYCNGCDVQSYIGLGTTNQTLQCEQYIYNGYTNSYSGGNFTAPSTPGLYFLIQNGTLDYSCQPQSYVNSSANAIGAILVGGTFDGCEGTIPYTYHYEDCSGLPFDWTYTYTVDHVTPPSQVGPPVPTTSTIECVSEATTPELPLVKDVCGITLQPVGEPSISGTYVGCEGTYILTYHYMDCSGLTFDWSYTYVIDIVTPPMQTGDPVPTSSTVECLSDATLPLLPTVESSCPGGLLPKVLLLFADPDDWGQDVQSKLMATGAFSAIDMLDVRYSTPSLSDLSGYNAVLGLVRLFICKY